VLLQEVHHRVANSLQIIASILMQSARRVQSQETRTYLHDANDRVLFVFPSSIAEAVDYLAPNSRPDFEGKDPTRRSSSQTSI
jgi:two-component sensor histidine kinase